MARNAIRSWNNNSHTVGNENNINNHNNENKNDSNSNEENECPIDGEDDLMSFNEAGRPKRLSTIIFKDTDDKTLKEAKVISTGKQNTKDKNKCVLKINDLIKTIDFKENRTKLKYKDWCTVTFVESEEKVADEKETKRKEKQMEEYGVHFLKQQHPVDVLATLVPAHLHNDPDIIDAKLQEIEKWKSFEAMEEVADDGQERIDCRWAVTRKEGHDGLKVGIKARFCIRGFKEHEVIRSDFPTVDRMSLKILLSLAGNFGWNIASIDITSAFLQGSSLERDLFVMPPVEAGCNGRLWKMKKAAYAHWP